MSDQKSPSVPPTPSSRWRAVASSVLLLAVAGLLNGWSEREEDGCGNLIGTYATNVLTGKPMETQLQITLEPPERRAWVARLGVKGHEELGASWWGDERLAEVPPGSATINMIVQAGTLEFYSGRPSFINYYRITAYDACDRPLTSINVDAGITFPANGGVAGPDWINVSLAIPASPVPSCSPSPSPLPSAPPSPAPSATPKASATPPVAVGGTSGGGGSAPTPSPSPSAGGTTVESGKELDNDAQWP